MVFFKSLVLPLFNPLPISLTLLLLGLLFLWFTRRQRAGKILVTIGTLVCLVFSLGVVSGGLLQALEGDYPPLSPARMRPEDGIKWVVVLGGGHFVDSRLPTGSRLPGASLSRLIEGIHLHRELPGSKLLLSAGSITAPVPGAEVMSNVAQALGVDKQDLVLETESKTTEDQARLIKSIVGDEKFILVTSASHMPRSMKLFRAQGMDPIPAPTEHLTNLDGSGSLANGLYPRAPGLTRTERALHEYAGMLWAWVRGRVC